MRSTVAVQAKAAAMTPDTKPSVALSRIAQEDRKEADREARAQLWNVLRLLLVGTALAVSCIGCALVQRPPAAARPNGAMAAAVSSTQRSIRMDRGVVVGMAAAAKTGANISVLEQLPVAGAGGVAERHREKERLSGVRDATATSIQPGPPEHQRVMPSSSTSIASTNAAPTLEPSAECKALLRGGTAAAISRSRLAGASKVVSCGGDSSGHSLISGELLLLLRGRFVVRNASVVPATRSGATSRAAAVVLCKRALKRSVTVDRQARARSLRDQLMARDLHMYTLTGHRSQWQN